ncbi:hypothetical protein [Streptomyces sp. G45]|uniref:hypothetical protein n=1 Tax=Streptomyces sp. G45 TaxID=3406627 RepID=UPI003C144F57
MTPRKLLITTVTALPLAAGAALLISTHTTNTPSPEASPRPTTPVTYEVTGRGTADITYLTRTTTATRTAVPLPWKKTVPLPRDEQPILRIQLPAKGGEAHCTLAIQGHHQQRATAYGAYGKAVCTGRAAPRPGNERP